MKRIHRSVAAASISAALILGGTSAAFAGPSQDSRNSSNGRGQVTTVTESWSTSSSSSNWSTSSSESSWSRTTTTSGGDSGTKHRGKGKPGKHQKDSKSKKGRKGNHSRKPASSFQDLNGAATVFQITKETIKNPNFRTAAWTADDLQITLMSIPVGGDVGLEIHPDTDQFFRVESGQGQLQVGSETELDFVKNVGEDDVMIVPQGAWHNVVNTGDTPLQMYVLYAPAHHPAGTVHPTQADDPHSNEEVPSPQIADATAVEEWTGDPGAVPFVTNISEATRANTNFRTAAWTGELMQLTLMDIPVGGDVGLEMHDDVDQFLRVESGRARVYFGDSEDDVTFQYIAQPGDAILVPAGKWHNIVNASSNRPLELYSIYGPPNHDRGTVHETQEDDDHDH